jgi:DNA-binding NtrC family response regulator
MLAGGVTVGALAVRVPEDCPCAGAGGLAFLLALGSLAASLLVSLEHAELMRSDLDRLRAVSGESNHLVGISKAMQDVRAAIHETAESGLSVLILGATGTGKELAARMVHDVSTRSTGPFVVVTCAAIPSNLLESELFGYDKGAFTGAEAAKAGRFELADGGTLFLDEVGDLGPECQARVLRAIESGTFHRLGGVHETKVNVRVVSATNKDIRKAVEEGTFRQDLYHRLNGFEITMPPLCDRPSDIPVLAEHFLELGRAKAKRPIVGFSQEAMRRLEKREWPGNVRELRAAVERAIARARSDIIEPDDLGGPTWTSGGELGVGTPVPLAEVEKRHIAAVLRDCSGNMSAASRVLGINRGTLYKKVRDYGIGT